MGLSPAVPSASLSWGVLGLRAVAASRGALSSPTPQRGAPAPFPPPRGGRLPSLPSRSGCPPHILRWECLSLVPAATPLHPLPVRPTCVVTQGADSRACRECGGGLPGRLAAEGATCEPTGKATLCSRLEPPGTPAEWEGPHGCQMLGQEQGQTRGAGGDGVGRARCGPAAPAWGPQSSPLQRPHLGPGKVRLASPAPSSSAEGPHPWDPGPLPPGNTGHVHFRPHRPAGVGKRVLPTCPAWVSIETPSETWGPENTLHSPHLIPMVTPRMSRPPRMTLSRSSGLWRSNNFPEPPRPRRARSEGAPSSRMWPPPFASETGSAPFSAWGVGWGRGVQIG